MDFRIADTFTASLARLTGDEQKAVKITVFDLQSDPTSPGLRWHKLDKAKDKHFVSVSVNMDIRIIVHKTDAGLLLCYVDHHEAAYRWAARRRIERHPRTGAAQLVEVRETVREIEVPVYVEAARPAPAAAPKPALFAHLSDDELLSYGVPADWLADAKGADEDSLFELVDHLPKEAGEALLELATGGVPDKPVQAATEADPFAHPDAQRRFRLMTDSQELQRALDYPWEKWIVYLHPSQRRIVEQSFGGPARVSGSAGTGKTVVALHRAAQLARAHPAASILLTTFSITLAKHLRRKLDRLVGSGSDVGRRIMVRAIDEVGLDLYEATYGKARVPTPKMLRTMIVNAAKAVRVEQFTTRFLETEWADVVDAWQLDSWEAYRDVARLGRKTRLGEKQRAMLWKVFEVVRTELSERGLVTMPGVFGEATRWLSDGHESGYDYAVVDESQDMGVPQMRFLAALAGPKPDGLFFAGDLGQRIFQTPFSWRSFGVDIRGRSQTLRVNYRTSRQIRSQADRLLPPELADVDGNSESRAGTISAFEGPEPVIQLVESVADEAELVAGWLTSRVEDGVEPHEIGVFVRSNEQLGRAQAAVKQAGFDAQILDSNTEPEPGRVSISTMHLAKGLEFRAVVVAACDDEAIPLQSRIEGIADEADLDDVYVTERHLLYVACTRARDSLLVTGVRPGSEFLEDMSQISVEL